MADSSELPEFPQNNNEDLSELNELERLTELAENTSVQLTWMAYDMVVLRTSPRLWASMSKLEEAYHRCRVAVCGDQEMERSASPTAPALTQI